MYVEKYEDDVQERSEEGGGRGRDGEFSEKRAWPFCLHYAECDNGH